jgi:hypothetical protein
MFKTIAGALVVFGIIAAAVSGNGSSHPAAAATQTTQASQPAQSTQAPAPKPKAKATKPVHISGSMLLRFMPKTQVASMCSAMHKADGLGVPRSFLKSAFARGYHPQASYGSITTPSTSEMWKSMVAYCTTH